MTDLRLINTLDGGELVQSGNDFATVSGIENTPFLKMFGGKRWVGNFLTDKPFQSETESVLNTVTLNSDGRLQIEQAVNRDLQYLSDIPGTTWSTSVVIAGPNSVNIGVTINGEQFNYLWNPEKDPVIFTSAPPPLSDFFSFDITTPAEPDFSISFKSFEFQTGLVNIEWGDSVSDSYSFSGTSIYGVSHSYSSFGSDRIGNVYYNDKVKDINFLNNTNLDHVYGALPTGLENFAVSSCDNYTSIPDLTILDNCAGSIQTVTLKQCPTVTGLNVFTTPGIYPNLSIIDFSENNLLDNQIDALLNNLVANKWDGLSPILVVINSQVDGGTYTAASLTARNAIIAAGGAIV